MTTTEMRNAKGKLRNVIAIESNGAVRAGDKKRNEQRDYGKNDRECS